MGLDQAIAYVNIHSIALAIKDTNSMQTHSIKLLRSDHTEMKLPGTKGEYVRA